MGWGTFILGRALGPRQKPTNFAKEFGDAADRLLANRLERETQLLEEIRFLQSEGREVDVSKIRKELAALEKFRRKGGVGLEIAILRKAQQDAMKGLKVDLAAIERELFEKRLRIPWMQISLWIFLPYVPAYQLFKKHIKKRGRNQDKST